MHVRAFLTVLAASLVGAAGGPAHAADRNFTIRMSHTLPATDPVGKGAERFKGSSSG